MFCCISIFSAIVIGILSVLYLIWLSKQNDQQGGAKGKNEQEKG